MVDHDHTNLETLAGLYYCVRDLIAERDRLRDTFTDIWCVLFGTTREAADVARLTVEQAVMLPTVLRGYREAAYTEQSRLRAVVTTLNARYVDHLDECAVSADYPCDCGLDDVFRQLDATSERPMVDTEVEALADRVAGLSPEARVDFLLGMLEKVGDERDQSRAVVEAAREAVAAQRAWAEKVKIDGSVRSTDDESHRKAASFATLALRVDNFNASRKTTNG